MTQTQIATENKKNWIRFGLVAMLFTCFFALMTYGGVAELFATGAGAAGQINTDPLKTVMDTVIAIITTAALYVGIVIILWGVFQIVMAMRREDSEAISKQITTIVVGAVLISLKFIIPALYDSLVKS